MLARTPMAPVAAFGVGEDERPGGERWGAHGALEKRKEGEKRGAAMIGHRPFKQAWRGAEKAGRWEVATRQEGGGGGHDAVVGGSERSVAAGGRAARGRVTQGRPRH
jgi:hypothetical protein